MNIGLMGGTFDPVHNGHIAVAEEARARLELAEVIFMPAAQTPLKEENCITSVEHRVEMVRLAIAGYPDFRLSTIEMNRTGPSYTIDTVSELRDLIGMDSEIFFIMGCDNLSSLHLWKEPERLIQSCRLVAVPRPGCTVPDLDILDKDVPGLSENVIILEKPYLDISATDIRQRIAQGLPISHLVPEPVEEYIQKHKLYIKKET